MARDRLRDFNHAERLHNETRVVGSPGASGRARIGRSGRAGGVRGQQAVAGGGLGTQIHHVTLQAVAGQTIAAGGAAVQWGTVEGPPTEVRGFSKLLEELGENTSVGAIPIDLTGELEWLLDGEFADLRASGNLTVTLVRDARADAPVTYGWGAAATRAFGFADDGWEVRAGDTVLFELPNGSGSGATLDRARLVLSITGVASPTSAASPWQQVYVGDVCGIVGVFGGWWITNGDTAAVTNFDGDWAQQSTFNANINPARGVGWDGTYLWVTGDTGGASSDGIRQYATDGTLVSSFDTSGFGAQGIAFDGTDLWFTEAQTAELRRYSTAGSLLQTISLDGVRLGIHYHAGQLYTVVEGAPTVEVRDPADGAVLFTIDTTGATSSPWGVWTDGTWLYVSANDGGVYRRRL